MTRWAAYRRSAIVALATTALALSACASDEDGFFDVRTLDHGDASSGATSGSGGSSGSGNQAGACIPDFCPVIASGAPCCMSARGPCGMDNGLGCQQLVPEADF